MKKALIVYGGWEAHEPYLISKIFKKILSENGFDVTLSDTLDIFGDVDLLNSLDIIIPVWTMGQIKPEYVDNICAAVERGTGMGGCHGGMCDSFRQSTKWQFLTGAQWVEHPGNDGVEYVVNINKDSNSPIILGIDDFTIVSEQYYIHYDPAVNILATTRFPGAPGPYTANGTVDVPVMYTKRWGKGKIFYSSLGHVANVFENSKPAFETMKRGLLWAGGYYEKD